MPDNNQNLQNQNNNGGVGNQGTDGNILDALVPDLGEGQQNNQQQNQQANQQQNQQQQVQDFGDVEIEGKKFKLDKDGNALGDDGKVFKTKADIEVAKASASNQSSQGAGVTIDGVDYTLDKDGNAVDKDGKVFMTKQQMDELEAGGDDTDTQSSLIEDIIAKSGVTITGEDGKPKQYADTEEGILEFANDLATMKLQETWKKTIEQNPLVVELYNHLAKGGKEEDFYQARLASWSKVNLKDADENRKMDIIVQDLKLAGMEEKEAKETAQLYRDSNKLDQYAEAAVKRRQKAEADAEVKRKADEETARRKEEENIVNYWKSVEDAVVKKGSLGKITIPEIERQPFFEYLSKPVNEHGLSQASIDFNSLSVEDRYQLMYQMYKKFDFSKLLINQANTQKARTLKSRLKARNDSNIANGQSVDQSQYQKSGGGDVTLENMII